MTRAKIYGVAAALGLLFGGVCAAPIAIQFSGGDPVAIQYDAPEAIDAGTLGFIDLSGTEADSFAYVVYPDVAFMVFEGGRKIVFATPTPGDYTFVIACAKGGEVGLVEVTVTVRGTMPPTPETFATRLKAAVRQVSSPNKDAELTGLHRTFDTIASMVAAGILTDSLELEAKIVEANGKVLDNNRAAWAGVSAVIKAELDARRPADVKAYAAVCRDIAAVLEGAINAE